MVHVVETEFDARMALTRVDYDAAFLDLSRLPFGGRFFLEWALRQSCFDLACIGEPPALDSYIDRGVAVESFSKPLVGSLVLNRLVGLLDLD